MGTPLANVVLIYLKQCAHESYGAWGHWGQSEIQFSCAEAFCDVPRSSKLYSASRQAQASDADLRTKTWCVRHLNSTHTRTETPVSDSPFHHVLMHLRAIRGFLPHCDKHQTISPLPRPPLPPHGPRATVIAMNICRPTTSRYWAGKKRICTAHFKGVVLIPLCALLYNYTHSKPRYFQEASGNKPIIGRHSSNIYQNFIIYYSYIVKKVRLLFTTV